MSLEARATTDIRSGGQVVVPRGSKLVGRVTQARPRGNSNGGGSAGGDTTSQLGIVFDRAVLKDGRTVALNGAVTALAAARAAGSTGSAGGYGAGSAGGSAAGSAGGIAGNVGGAVGGVAGTTGRATTGVGSAIAVRQALPRDRRERLAGWTSPATCSPEAAACSASVTWKSRVLHKAAHKAP